MKSITKKITLAGLGAACVLSLSLGAGVLAKNSGIANAAANGAPAATTFFYDNLLDENSREYTLAKKFYDVLEKMNREGDFKDGVVDYAINDVVTSDQLKAWVENGNLEIPRAFSAARDTFLTDHPEIFYINFYKLTISVAKSNGVYVGYVNSGKEANLYYDNGFNTPETVATAITNYESKVNEIVEKVSAKQASDTYAERDAYLAREVNRYLVELIDYDNEAYDNKDNENYVANPYINTSYGGLVEEKAVCGGYSTSYKVIMDKLGIPCITVNGYTNNRDEFGGNSASSTYHMWNYVWLETPAAVTAKSRAAVSDGEWYSIDVTWDYSAKNLYRYALLSAPSDAEIHVNDGVISSSGYRLRYPALSAYNYGSTGETDGIQCFNEYVPSSSLDDNGNTLMNTFVTVSYNGKSAQKLYEEDLYLAMRFADYREVNGKMEIVWTDWFSLEIFRQIIVDHHAGHDGAITDNGVETSYYVYPSVYYTQFTVFDVRPDRATPNSNSDSTLGHDPETEPYYFYYYSNDLLNKSTPVFISEIYENKTYGTYYAPPYVASSTPDYHVKQFINDGMAASGSQYVAANKAITIEVTYDQRLHVLDTNEKIGISFVSAHPDAQDYAKFFPLDSEGTLVKLSEDGYTLTFKFGPSLLYSHNDEDYHFIFTNVGSAETVVRIVNGVAVEETLNKLPKPLVLGFARTYLACPKVFNYDGRMWIDCCAQPTLITNSDLSATGFVDEDGNNLFTETQRSQLMLVAEKASAETVETMTDEISADKNINITKDDIIKSETYDIGLQMCGKIAHISDGSYMKIALGLPDGYDINNLEGVTFKLFHRKHDPKTDTYSIEEVPCVVTKFGIVAVVTSFSPYMVVAVDAEKATSKSIYASIEGNGGKLTYNDGKIQTLNEGGSYEYTIQPDDGYQIHTVTLNGVDVQNRIVNGKLSLGYDELDISNELVIEYISDAAKARIQQKIDNNVIDEQVNVEKFIVAVADQPVYPNTTLPAVNGTSGDGNPVNVAAIVISAICATAAIAAAVTAIVIVMRKKKAN